MSLSFVKSAVLSSTDGISHNEETTINNPETASVRNNPSGINKPLFEQLRANQEAQQSKDDEFQRSLRGMRPLDEEDVAHLDAVEEQRREVEGRVKSGIEREVALFRAAREDRGLVQTVVETNDDNVDDTKKSSDDNKGEVMQVAAVAKKKQIVPKFTIKKKRKRVDNNSHSKDHDDNNITAPKKANDAAESNKSNDDATGVNNNNETKQTKATDTGKDGETKSNNVANLLGLGCYGSDSDSD